MMHSCVSVVLCIDLVAPEWYEMKCFQLLDCRCSSEIDLFWADTHYMKLLYCIVLYWSAQERLSSSAKLLKRLRSRSKERGRVPRAACKTDEVYHPPRGFPDVLKRDRHHPPVKMDCQKMVLNKMCLEEMKLTISRNISLACIPGIVLVFLCFCS